MRENIVVMENKGIREKIVVMENMGEHSLHNSLTTLLGFSRSNTTNEVSMGKVRGDIVVGQGRYCGRAGNKLW